MSAVLISQPKYPDLWKSEKFISWPYTQANPIVRVPRARATPESKSFKQCEDERETFRRCLEYRNQRGVEIWGAARWAEILKSDARSASRERSSPASAQNGVTHQERGAWRGWVAAWYERLPDGSTRRKSASFGYGGSRTRYASSAEAFLAACQKRKEMQDRWYSAIGKGSERKVSRLD